jgi:hypothetical protein
MTSSRLRRARRRVAGLRQRPTSIRPREVIRLAELVGRKPVKRGKHPTYEMADRDDFCPLAIPDHPGTLKRGTAVNILNQLEGDIEQLESEEQERNNGTREDGSDGAGA